MKKKNMITIILMILLFCSISVNVNLLSRDVNKNRTIKEGKEIEKKWLIHQKDIPYDLSKADKYQVEQTYICFEPEIRIRKINNGERYTLTIKSNMSVDGLIRDELEYYITEESYKQLIVKKEGNTIYKTRYQLYDKDQMREIDIFKGNLSGLAYMETEFANEEWANREPTPDWVIKDVTNDKRYKNQSLAQYGIPVD